MMESLFNPADREALSHRLATLEPQSQRLWGKMAGQLGHDAMQHLGLYRQHHNRRSGYGGQIIRRIAHPISV